MIILLKIINESIRQAWQQLLGNKLRSFLSLLGITIGIFCVVAVMAALDSLEYSIRKSFKQLGDNVIYVDRFEWGKPVDDKTFERWLQRPNPSFDEYRKLKTVVPSAENACYAVFFSSELLQWQSNTVEGNLAIAVTEEFADVFSINFSKGRFFNQSDYKMGTPTLILGSDVAETLFGTVEPLDKEIKIMGRKAKIVGIIEKSGNNLFSPLPFDRSVLVAYPYAAKITDIENHEDKGVLLNVSPVAGVSIDRLKDDIVGIMRATRRLKPRVENNFALNKTSIFDDAVSQLFASLSFASWVIGGFAMLVGMFSVANIMFVSVKERTSLIGVKMAIGAKRYMILLEFLIESIVLCTIGGLLGLLFVALSAKAISSMFEYDIFLSMKNIIIGVVISAVTGIIAGGLPALQASRMDPVEAIRS